jgi:hypothetical protein
VDALVSIRAGGSETIDAPPVRVLAYPKHSDFFMNRVVRQIP